MSFMRSDYRSRPHISNEHIYDGWSSICLVTESLDRRSDRNDMDVRWMKGLEVVVEEVEVRKNIKPGGNVFIRNSDRTRVPFLFEFFFMGPRKYYPFIRDFTEEPLLKAGKSQRVSTLRVVQKL